MFHIKTHWKTSAVHSNKFEQDLITKTIEAEETNKYFRIPLILIKIFLISLSSAATFLTHVNVHMSLVSDNQIFALQTGWNQRIVVEW